MRKSTFYYSLIVMLALPLQPGYAHGRVSSGDANLTGIKPEVQSRSGLSVSCYMPSWTATSNITSTSATFSWGAVPGADSYSVQTRLPGGTWYYTPGSPYYSTTSVTVDGFLPNTTYEWRVRANCWGGENSAWTYPVTFTTLGAYCTPPSWLSTTYITSSSAFFEWAWVSGALNYTIQWRIAGGNWSYLPGSPFTNTFVELGGLQSGTTYEWRVRSNCSGGMYSNWSYIATFTTQGAYCNTPTWPLTSNITSTTATLSWDPVPGAVSYSVQIRLSNGSWSYVPGSPFNSTWVTVTGLTPSSNYEWRVRANCYNGQYSNWTWPISFTTSGGNSCQAPAWLFTTNITSTSATFDWDPVSGANSYSIQWRYTNGGSWNDLPGGPFTNTWVNVTGLQPATSYEWRVRSNCSYGYYSVWSYPAWFTTLGNYTCSVPTWPSTINITSTTATFHWDAVPGAQNYTVEIKWPSGSWTTLPGSPTAYTTITAYGLSPGTTYQWRVRANCSNWLYSEWTWPVTFTTLNIGCSTPQWLYTTNITQTSATFDWDPVPGAINYAIQWRYAGGTWYNLPGGPFTNTWVNVTGLQPGTEYQWRVKAYCSYQNWSEWSYPAWFTTLAGYTCSTPTWPSTLSVTSTSATVHWDAVPGALSYTVQKRLPNGSWYDVPGSPFTNTTATITGLSPNTTYEWRVRANCSNWQYSGWTWPISFTTTGGYCYATSWLSTTNITQNSATFEWAAVSGAQSYMVQYRIAGGTWYDVPGSPFNGTWVNVTGLQPGTNYEWHVKTICSNNTWSGWSYTATFTTLGSGGGGNNDNCSDATWLTVGNSCSYTSGSNINASPSVPAPSGACYAGGYKDVWFRFTMPGGSNPEVTIRTTSGSLMDGVMEVYMGSSCSNLTYLTCEDDNNNGNGSTMPVINLWGNAGATIWVRVWGYNGASGTFNICVFNYYSANFSVPVTDEQPTYSGDLIGDVTDEIASQLNQEPEGRKLVDFEVSPNPANEILYISSSLENFGGISALALCDLSGKRVWMKRYENTELSEFHERVDVSQIPPGLYVVQLVTTEGIMTEKVMISR